MSSTSVHPLIPIEIRIQRLPNGGGLPLPAYASDGAAGMDVVAAETLTLRPGTRHAVATGFAMAIPPGYEVQVRPRCECPVDIERGKVKEEWRMTRDAISRASIEVPTRPFNEMNDIGMRDDDALWNPRGSGRIQDVSGIAGGGGTFDGFA